MTLKDDLIAARALIDTPEKWGQGLGRRRACLCISDAIIRTADTATVPLGEQFEALSKQLPAGFRPEERDGQFRVVSFNDLPTTKHPAIMALFDSAIESAS